ncbi:MAG: hypothetical protein AAFW47_06110 [Pseudomonadota bacterium]
MAKRMTNTATKGAFLPALTAVALSAATVTTSMVATSTSASANVPRCSSHDSITTHLAKRYGETPRGLGLVSDKGIMEVFVSKQGTWTILMTNPNGTSCLIAAGKGWEDIQSKLEDPEA